MIMLFSLGFIASIAGYYYIKDVFIKHRISTLHDTLTVTSAGITHHIQDRMQKVNSIAELQEVITFLASDNRTTSDVVKQRITSATHSKIILFSSEKKQVWSSDGSSNVEYDKALQSCLETARILFEASLSDFIDISSTSEKKLFICIPVMNGKKYVGSVAMELENETFVTIIKQGYEHIGQSSDIVLAKKIGDKAIVIFPTRSDKKAAFNVTLQLGDPIGIPLQEAVCGGRGEITGKDLLGVNSIISWNYIPVTGWGITARQSMDEINNALFNIWLVALLISVVCLGGISIFFYFIWRSSTGKVVINNVFFIRIPCIVSYSLFICNLLLFMHFFNYYYNRVRMEFSKNDTVMSISLQHAAQRINYTLSNIERVAQTLAFNIRNKQIKTAQASSLVQSDVKKNHFIQTLTIATKNNNHTSWDGIALTVHNGETAETPLSINQDTEWLHQAITHGASWMLPKNENHDFIYTMPIKSKDNEKDSTFTAVLAISCPVSSFIKEIRSSLEGFIKYFVINFDGKIVYQDPGIRLQSNELNPQKHNGSIWYAKMPSLSWYLGGVSTKRSPYWYFIVPFLIHTIGALINIIFITRTFTALKTICKNITTKHFLLLAMVAISCLVTLILYVWQ
ncbi:MAG: cache domain-containing protein [Candidatus Dependentiae bacterium]|nr:cache domain-containing protein [Candidatus Dependentiae bacterium]